MFAKPLPKKRGNFKDRVLFFLCGVAALWLWAFLTLIAPVLLDGTSQTSHNDRVSQSKNIATQLKNKNANIEIKISRRQDFSTPDVSENKEPSGTLTRPTEQKPRGSRGGTNTVDRPSETIQQPKPAPSTPPSDTRSQSKSQKFETPQVAVKQSEPAPTALPSETKSPKNSQKIKAPQAAVNRPEPAPAAPPPSDINPQAPPQKNKAPKKLDKKNNKSKTVSIAKLSPTAAPQKKIKTAKLKESPLKKIDRPRTQIPSPTSKSAPSNTGKIVEIAPNEIAPKKDVPAFLPIKPAADEVDLETKIGQMLLIGFSGTQPDTKRTKPIAEHIASGKVGGVLFMGWNVRSRGQILRLTKFFREAGGDLPPLVAVDQEGGLVQRLRMRGFRRYPSAKAVAARLTPEKAKELYKKMATELRDSGFNMNFAPVVDLDVHRRNPIIGSKKRSFGADPEQVYTFARSFISAHRELGVLTSLKHFPGHGSSRTDSHRQLVDLSHSWIPEEVSPYRSLLRENLVDAVMVGHLYHPEIVGPVKYPATLSSRAVKGYLRKEIGFNGLVITDDLEMGAITRNYDLSESLIMAINAGNDILLLSNRRHRDPQLPTKAIKLIKQAVEKGRIRKANIDRTYRRILAMKKKLLVLEKKRAIELAAARAAEEAKIKAAKAAAKAKVAAAKAAAAKKAEAVKAAKAEKKAAAKAAASKTKKRR